MTGSDTGRFTAFEGHKRLAAGSLYGVTLAVKAAEEQGVDAPLLVFEDSTGRVVEVDTRGSTEDIRARLAATPQPANQPAPPRDGRRPRGRPKLGVVAGEVTLLPRHWDWLRSQPGGASASLRKLVEVARRNDQASPRRARETAYGFMSVMAGDLPDFEEAARALFAGDRERFGSLIGRWPEDVRDHCRKMTALAFPA
ncbi:DUF2239 family protein [Pelagibius litoralis]|uniref:DUF2239 family protein n=1 Tax=Pelagibius litoralis TaxID=374515 RepID=A0A967F1A2_9PROT|nr:DUF2239 family protein [Pelagibius litoralis]NIA71198.1 DUF2239 family protein [Pelagibius litoralis]